MMADDGKHQAGFTLLEVLVALAVIAFALAAIIHAAGAMTSNTVYLQDKTHAHWIAMNQMAEIRRQQAWPMPSTQKKDIKFYGREWQQITKFSAVAESANIMRIDISVLLADGDEDLPITTLISFISNPQISRSVVPGIAVPDDPGQPIE
jgi:general secretion pathway protein I